MISNSTTHLYLGPVIALHMVKSAMLLLLPLMLQTLIVLPRLRQYTSKPPPSSESRDYNFVLFCLTENKSLVDTKESVDEMLVFLAGKPVLLNDMFRLGKYNSSSGSQGSHQPHPILVKLTTQWY